jgi:hypothetical protein
LSTNREATFGKIQSKSMEREQQRELLVRLKPVRARISVRKELWPEFAEDIPTDRVVGTVIKWVRKHHRIRVD